MRTKLARYLDVSRASASRLVEWWIDRRWLDFVAAVAMVATHYALAQKWSVLDVFSFTEAADRRQAYTAAAILVGLIGAFSGVGIAQLASSKTREIERLKELHAEELVSNWLSIYRGALLAGLAAIFCLVLDVKGNKWGTSWAPWMFETAVIFAVFKFARLGELFRPVITSNLRSEDDDVAPPLTFNDNWDQKAS